MPNSATDAVRFRWLLTLFVAAFELAHLAWQWAHGGIVSHHLLADPALPSVSNGWGLLALPALAWLLSGRFLRRAGTGPARRAVLTAALGAAAAGLVLSLAFSLGSSDHAALVLAAILLGAIALPVYRAEYLLGFVMGMAWTFGPILPVLIGTVIALVSLTVRRAAWPAMKWAAGRVVGA